MSRIALSFLRGDTNADSLVDISDAIARLTFFFSGVAAPACLEADDSSALAFSDAVYTLGYLLLGTSESSVLFAVCGDDASENTFVCEMSMNSCN